MLVLTNLKSDFLALRDFSEMGLFSKALFVFFNFVTILLSISVIQCICHI